MAHHAADLGHGRAVDDRPGARAAPAAAIELRKKPVQPAKKRPDDSSLMDPAGKHLVADGLGGAADEGDRGGVCTEQSRAPMQEPGAVGAHGHLRAGTEVHHSIGRVGLAAAPAPTGALGIAGVRGRAHLASFPPKRLAGGAVR